VELYFDGPGIYIVKTLNDIDAELMEMFAVSGADAQISEKSRDYTYRLSVKDQSELIGFLTTLYNQHHTILKVEHLVEHNNN
jgi:hypothetical protein